MTGRNNFYHILPQLGNHDRIRMSNRMGEEFVDAFNMLLLTLPGTPFTYYGEEIGMIGRKISFEETKDPYGLNFGPKRYEEFSRDPSRTPMQWSSDRNGGFTTAKKPWLPLHDNFKTLNVEVSICLIGTSHQKLLYLIFF